MPVRNADTGARPNNLQPLLLLILALGNKNAEVSQ